MIGTGVVLGIQWLQKLGWVTRLFEATLEFELQEKKEVLRGDETLALKISFRCKH